MSVNSLIFSRPTLTPTTRATSTLSPMNKRCSPKRWRLSTNHKATATAVAHSACTGTTPMRPTSTVWIA